MKISVVTPLFNEAENVFSFVDRLETALSGYSFEVIMVDNGSRDNTLVNITELSRTKSQVIGVALTRNFGYDGGILAGLSQISGDWIVIIDGDNQDPPEEIPRLLEAAFRGYDIVYGLRRTRTEQWYVRWLYKLFYLLLDRLSTIDIPRDAGNFCVVSRRVANHLVQFPERVKFIRGLRAWTGFPSTGIEYEREFRSKGTTSFSKFSLIAYATSGILSFSTVPIRAFSILGILGIIVSCFLGIMVVTTRALGLLGVPFFEYIASGFSSLAILMLVGISINLLGLGIIGEYISTIFTEVKGRPPFIVIATVTDGDIHPT